VPSGRAKGKALCDDAASADIRAAVKTKENAMSNGCKWVQPLFVGVVSASLVLVPVPRASAGLVEYAIIIPLISILLLAVDGRGDLPPGSQVLIVQLEESVDGARAANLVQNRTLELSRLSKAIGAAEALLGMTTACDDCDELRGLLQEVIGDAAALKTAAVGASGTCHPNGVLEPNEQCDPRAIPPGCPVTTELTYCSDECRCVPVP
jgi:hypothetical protein